MSDETHDARFARRARVAADPTVDDSAAVNPEGAELEAADGAGSGGAGYEEAGYEDDYADEERGRGRSFLDNVWGGLKEIVIIAVMAVVLSFVVKTWLLQAFYIPSGSMEDTLVKDDRVVVSKLTPGPFDLARGDIVVFQDPDHWLGEVPRPPEAPGVRGALHRGLQFIGLLPDDSDDHLIKRVIGLPGDHVVCCDASGKLTVNGAAVTETYVKQGDTPGGGRAPFDITVPADRVWVMGDHRSDSSDSRFHDDGTGALGSVPITDITGRAVTIVWPLEHVKWLSAPGRVFEGVPAPSPASQQRSTPTPATTSTTTKAG